MSNSSSSTNIIWHPNRVTNENRNNLLGQQGCVLWMTGLSGSGKSTLAVELEARLVASRHAAFVLDGDNIRHGLNGDLDFSPAGRKENIRRIAHVAALLADAGLIAITAFISPYAEDRAQARTIINHSQAGTAHRFLEIFVDTPLAICEQRDPKALYAKARRGEIADFTGIQAPFEAPLHPDIHVPTGHLPVTDCVNVILTKLQDAGLLQPGSCI
jgi:adenylyl-sulfate kinase